MIDGSPDQSAGSPNPEQAPQHAPQPAPPGLGSGVGSGQSWFQRLTSVLFILFCFELGLFLLIYPWTDGWSDNYFAWVAPGPARASWHAFWNNSYFRGALSGLGIVNLWIAIMEVFHMFARRHADRR